MIGAGRIMAPGGIAAAVSGNTPKGYPICAVLSVRHMERVRRKTPTNHAFLRLLDEVR